MNRTILGNLMTFVVLSFGPSSAHSAPQNEAPDIHTQESTETENQKNAIEEKSLSIATTEKKEIIAPESLFYPYTQAMSPRVGLALNPDNLRDGEVPLVLGIMYQPPKRRSPRFEYGFDLITDGTAHITVAARKIWYEQRYFRPFVRLGGTLRAKADQRIATITDIDNYLVRIGGGFEDVIDMPMSVRLEIELLAGMEEQLAIISLGYSWGW